MLTSKTKLIKNSIIFLINLFKASITIKTFDIIENIEKSLKNPEHKKELI